MVEPTVLAYTQTTSSSVPSPLSDLDYLFGTPALNSAPAAAGVTWPVTESLDATAMEKIWAASIYKHLRVFPEDNNFIVTESPLNSPENRALTAEIFFETFDAAGLHIGDQALLALYASFAATERSVSASRSSLTGLVVDSGENSTHCIPGS